MTDLLPCPFCGGKGNITLGVSPRGQNTVDVICEDCSGTMPAFCEADAVTDWNQRPKKSEAVSSCLTGEPQAVTELPSPCLQWPGTEPCVWPHCDCASPVTRPHPQSDNSIQEK